MATEVYLLLFISIKYVTYTYTYINAYLFEQNHIAAFLKDNFN